MKLVLVLSLAVASYADPNVIKGKDGKVMLSSDAGASNVITKQSSENPHLRFGRNCRAKCKIEDGSLLSGEGHCCQGYECVDKKNLLPTGVGWCEPSGENGSTWL